MKRDLLIIEAPFNLGLKPKHEGHVPGVDKLPNWLKQFGFHERLAPKERIHIEAPPFKSIVDEESQIRNCNEVIEYSKRLAQPIQETVASNLFPVVIGGDCSILVGCTLGLRMTGRYGLFFMDGHTDFVPPSYSKTKAAAGMDLYIVAGYAHSKLADLQGLMPYCPEESILAYGNRYFDREYVGYIRSSKIDYCDLHEIRKAGPQTVVSRFLQKIREQELDGFWVHFDVDALGHDLMPAVDSPNEGGLTYEELASTLEPLLKSPLASGIDMTILDPDLDPDGRHTELFVEELTTLINKART